MPIYYINGALLDFKRAALSIDTQYLALENLVLKHIFFTIELPFLHAKLTHTTMSIIQNIPENTT